MVPPPGTRRGDKRFKALGIHEDLGIGRRLRVSRSKSVSIAVKSFEDSSMHAASADGWSITSNTRSNEYKFIRIEVRIKL